MTVDEIKIKKKELEQSIRQSIIDFNRSTGVIIDEIRCKSHTTEFADGTIAFTEVTVKAEINI